MKKNRAKEIFFQYHGSKFFMWHEGELDEYEQFDVSREQEILWKDELANYLLSQLKVQHDNVLIGLNTLITCFGDYNLFAKVKDFIEINISKTDSFLKVLYAEWIINILESFKNCNRNCPKELVKDAKKLAKEILNQVINNEITICEESDKILVGLMKNISNEDYLIERAKKCKKSLGCFA